MFTLQTERFGDLVYEEGSIIEFPVGLPGFETETRFLLVLSQLMHPLIFLQSMTTADLCFTTVPVQFVDPAYRLYLSSRDLQLLGTNGNDLARSGTDQLCLGILCAGDGAAPTVNLLGPIVIDQRRRLGVQAVREDTLYSAQHPLFPENRGEPKCL